MAGATIGLSLGFGLAIVASGCGVGVGAIVPVGSYDRSTSGGSTCTNYAGKVGPCGADYSQNRRDYAGSEYETETGFGMQAVFRRGIGAAASGDQSASGRTYDLGVEFIVHGANLSYGLELGITRQDLGDFGADYDHSASYLMPRIQRSFGRLAVYGGIGYLGLATLDLPSGFGQEGASVRFVGGLRIGIPIQLGFLDALVLGAEGQRTQVLGDLDYATNAIVGSVTTVVAF